MSEKFTCANCGGQFARDEDWSDEDAVAEAVSRLPAEHFQDGIAVVCDDCYKAIMGRVQIEAPQLLLAGAPRVAGACYRTAAGHPVHVRPNCKCPR